jgi:hypothetical protein
MRVTGWRFSRGARAVGLFVASAASEEATHVAIIVGLDRERLVAYRTTYAST